MERTHQEISRIFRIEASNHTLGRSCPVTILREQVLQPCEPLHTPIKKVSSLPTNMVMFGSTNEKHEVSCCRRPFAVMTIVGTCSSRRLSPFFSDVKTGYKRENPAASRTSRHLVSQHGIVESASHRLKHHRAVRANTDDSIRLVKHSPSEMQGLHPVHKSHRYVPWSISIPK
jgi:hypothetical protein